LILPVPLSNERLRGRGYNQAVELARPLARAARARVDVSVLTRTRDTAAQAELPWAERVKNVRGAFHCAHALPDASVAVVDDVMTTGATLNEIAATLKRAGAARVVNWVVARTPPPA
jgi:ComF family protein